jgi:hypothetical protein
MQSPAAVRLGAAELPGHRNASTLACSTPSSNAGLFMSPQQNEQRKGATPTGGHTPAHPPAAGHLTGSRMRTRPRLRPSVFLGASHTQPHDHTLDALDVPRGRCPTPAVPCSASVSHACSHAAPACAPRPTGARSRACRRRAAWHTKKKSAASTRRCTLTTQERSQHDDGMARLMLPRTNTASVPHRPRCGACPHRARRASLSATADICPCVGNAPMHPLTLQARRCGKPVVCSCLGWFRGAARPRT